MAHSLAAHLGFQKSTALNFAAAALAITATEVVASVRLLNGTVFNKLSTFEKCCFEHKSAF